MTMPQFNRLLVCFSLLWISSVVSGGGMSDSRETTIVTHPTEVEKEKAVTTGELHHSLPGSASETHSPPGSASLPPPQYKKTRRQTPSSEQSTGKSEKHSETPATAHLSVEHSETPVTALHHETVAATENPPSSNSSNSTSKTEVTVDLSTEHPNITTTTFPPPLELIVTHEESGNDTESLPTTVMTHNVNDGTKTPEDLTSSDHETGTPSTVRGLSRYPFRRKPAVSENKTQPTPAAEHPRDFISLFEHQFCLVVLFPGCDNNWMDCATGFFGPYLQEFCSVQCQAKGYRGGNCSFAASSHSSSSSNSSIDDQKLCDCFR